MLSEISGFRSGLGALTVSAVSLTTQTPLRALIGGREIARL
jgi:hypothetical protein